MSLDKELKSYGETTTIENQTKNTDTYLQKGEIQKSSNGLKVHWNDELVNVRTYEKIYNRANQSYFFQTPSEFSNAFEEHRHSLKYESEDNISKDLSKHSLSKIFENDDISDNMIVEYLNEFNFYKEFTNLHQTMTNMTISSIIEEIKNMCWIIT